jgi:hypothetical protein
MATSAGRWAVRLNRLTVEPPPALARVALMSATVM